MSFTDYTITNVTHYNNNNLFAVNMMPKYLHKATKFDKLTYILLKWPKWLKNTVPALIPYMLQTLLAYDFYVYINWLGTFFIIIKKNMSIQLNLVKHKLTWYFFKLIVIVANQWPSQYFFFISSCIKRDKIFTCF